MLDNTAGRTVTGKKRGAISKIRYQVEGEEFEATLNDLVYGPKATVYVNPNDPTQVVAKRGVTTKSVARPMILTVASGLFGVVLCLIAFSPKED